MPKFIELAIGTASNRFQIRTVDSLNEYVKEAQKKGLQLFRSLYLFDESLEKYVSEHQSVKGFSGVHEIDEIILDVDRGTKSNEDTLLAARALCHRLSNDLLVPEEEIKPYFSGTGYHIHLPNLTGLEPATNLAQIMQKNMNRIFPECDNIYDQHRLVRVSGTLNDKSKLYKIPLTLTELHNLTSDEIHTLASSPRDFQHSQGISTPILSGYFKERDTVKELPKSSPSGVVTCMQKLYDGGDLPGERHASILSMASSFRRAGIPLSGVSTLMHNWSPSLERSNPGEIDRLVSATYEHDYRFSCSSPMFVKFCDPKCMFYQYKNFDSHIVNPDTMEHDYAAFMKTDFTQTAFNLGHIYRLHEDYWIYPGEFVLVFGDTGMGKTSLVQNWCVKLNHMKILYYSLEVHQNLLFRKFIQMAENIDKNAAMNLYKDFGQKSHADKISHIRVSTKSPSLYEMRKHIAELQPGLVIVDTTDSVVMERIYGLDKEDAIGRGLKELAQSLNTIIIGIHHIAKQNPAFGQQSLTVHSGKGSSTVEQKADKVISIEGSRDFPIRTIKSQKARDEGYFAIKVQIDWKTFNISQIS